MRIANRVSGVSVGIALIMALTGFVFGSAPFTPALGLAIIALPIAIACSFFGVWRLSVMTIYWAIAALMAVPMSRLLHLGVDIFLVILGVAGLALSAILYNSYMRSK